MVRQVVSLREAHRLVRQARNHMHGCAYAGLPFVEQAHGQCADDGDGEDGHGRTATTSGSSYIDGMMSTHPGPKRA